ncbi:hypothetical protein HHI36_007724 [Cryptolaemus montrouzieri]|uniref:Major facilitator superfamily (MFS) profile domain-containing protein n=1 Tax=Cryptolaemus montrouzieri TaxID=559131 RepID=A0ABD2MQJ6_9CUCU
MKYSEFLTRFQGCSAQLLPATLGTLNAISDGMQFGWTSPMIPRLQSKEAPFQITHLDVIFIEVTFMLAGLLGIPITIFLVDKVGRKKSVLIASSSCLIGWTLIGVANHVSYIYVARFIMGTASDMAFISSPMYIAEIATPKIRGFLAGIIHLMTFTGLLLMYCIGPFVPFYVPSIVGAFILLVQLSTFPFMPESPYFLISKNREDEARVALCKLRKSNGDNKDLEKEFWNITAAVKRQTTESRRIQDLWMIKSNRKAIIIMTMLNGAQHFGCLTVMLMNLHLILAAAESVYISAHTCAILFAALLLISNFISVLLVDRFGRKVLLISSGILTGITLFIIGLFFHLKHHSVDVQGISWIPVVGVMLYAVVFKSGMGSVPIVMTAELFPSNMKAIGMGYADGIYVILSALSVYIYYLLVENFGIFLPFYIFSSCCFLSAIFTVILFLRLKEKH